MKIKRTLVILTRNEIEGGKALFEKIPLNTAHEVFVVDYKSHDGTVEFFKEKRIGVIAQKKKGRGEAFRLAAKIAKGESLVFFSPDGNEDPKDIPKLFGLLEKGCDMAIASRFLPGARNEEDDQVFKFRAWANRSFTFLANLFFNREGKYVTDTINGYRGIRKRIFDLLKPDAVGFVIEYQMTIRAMKKGLKICEIPTFEGARIGGESQAKSIPTGLIFLRYLLREVFLGNNF